MIRKELMDLIIVQEDGSWIERYEKPLID